MKTVLVLATASVLLGQDVASLSGKWIGKLDGLTAVELRFDSASPVRGAATFYMIRTDEARPRVAGKSEAAIENPRMNGKRLSFDVISKDGPRPMTLTLSSNTEAALVNADGDLVKMTKEK